MGGSVITGIVVGVLALIAGGAIGFVIRHVTMREARLDAEAEVARRLEEVEQQAKQIVLAAQAEALETRNTVEADLERRRSKLHKEEERLQSRRDRLDERQEQMEKREQTINKRQSTMDRQRNEIEKLHSQRLEALEKVAAMTQDEARDELLNMVRENARQDMAQTIRQVETEAKEEADRRAREIITIAMQRLASDQVAEMTVSTIDLPSDEMKGRIIGRSGRNIRAFEKAAGVDVIVDDTFETVTVSCFDPVRREIARRAMERLVTDGRIHPTRIEKLLSDARKEVEKVIREEGEAAAYEAEVPGLHPEILKLLGRLKFRTSYGQNQLAHSIESAKLASLLAAELGANVEIARAAGLLHDLGKAVDFEVEGTHAVIGADICRRYGVSAQVVNAVAAHHHETEGESLEAIIVEIADAISGARPGARRESLELYLKRIRSLEEIAASFSGVAETYAIQAGREIRVIVKPEDIDDLATIELSRNIAKRIEEGMEYPGQIKVTVIRETRAIEFAK